MAKAQPSQTVRPFLKWPGGKYRLISILKSYLPKQGCLIEPFVGAGALFLNTEHQQVVLNDINVDLINLYKQIQTTPDKFIKEAKRFFHTKHNNERSYYRHRTRFNESDDPFERSTLFLYLNRHGYNGLCRYNLKGFYNVPFGAYKQPYFPHDELEAFYLRTQTAKLHCESYVSLLNQFLTKPSLKGMVFYCDPPYAPLSLTANFTGYAAQPFTLEDQKKLAQLALALNKKGASVLISNHDTPFTREIYQGAKLYHLEVSRTISCKGGARNKVGELIACFGGK
jgi:DNA adenine methylase